MLKNINVLILKLRDLTAFHIDSIRLRLVIPALSDSDENAVIALHRSAACTNAHNDQKFWGNGDNILVSLAPYFGRTTSLFP